LILQRSGWEQRQRAFGMGQHQVLVAQVPRLVRSWLAGVMRTAAVFASS
jgi:hypothetical protein